MSVSRRGDSWRARYYGPDGRQRSKSFKRKSDAERWLIEQRSLIDQDLSAYLGIPVPMLYRWRRCAPDSFRAMLIISDPAGHHRRARDAACVLLVLVILGEEHARRQPGA